MTLLRNILAFAGLVLPKLLFALCVFLLFFSNANAQNASGNSDTIIDPEPIIDINTDPSTDAAINARISGIFSQLDGMEGIDVFVSQGVVTLSGTAANETTINKAEEIATRTKDVVTVQDNIDITTDIESHVLPLFSEFKIRLHTFYKNLPLIFIALTFWVLITLVGYLLSKTLRVSKRLSEKNFYLQDVLNIAIQLVFFISGFIVALRILGAGGAITALLGGAGVLGIAVSISIRDTLNNYLSSMLLALKQPFRTGDHVLINDKEGYIMRMTSRATVLMTPNGNQLRIPNSEVFIATILNYTINSQRRFVFTIRIDDTFSSKSAMQTGLAAIQQLDFVLKNPAPFSLIDDVIDAQIALTFKAWLDQSKQDFDTGRSRAISAVLADLRDEGYTISTQIIRVSSGQGDNKDINIDKNTSSPDFDVDMQLGLGKSLKKIIDAEMINYQGSNLLGDNAPKE